MYPFIFRFSRFSRLPNDRSPACSPAPLLPFGLWSVCCWLPSPPSNIISRKRLPPVCVQRANLAHWLNGGTMPAVSENQKYKFTFFKLEILIWERPKALYFPSNYQNSALSLKTEWQNPVLSVDIVNTKINHMAWSRFTANKKKINLRANRKNGILHWFFSLRREKENHKEGVFF